MRLLFPDVELPVGFGQTRTAKLLPMLTMVCGYSRFALAMLLPSRSAEDLAAGLNRPGFGGGIDLTEGVESAAPHDEVVAAAMIDRLVHHADVVVTSGTQSCN